MKLSAAQIEGLKIAAKVGRVRAIVADTSRQPYDLNYATIKALVARGLLQSIGTREYYTITDAGRQELAKEVQP